jgi:hypothetical protein
MSPSTIRWRSASEEKASCSATVTCARRFWRTPLEMEERVKEVSSFCVRGENSVMRGSMTDTSFWIVGRRSREEFSSASSWSWTGNVSWIGRGVRYVELFGRGRRD